MRFDELPLHPDLLKGIKDMRFETATPIQEQAIPPILEGKDLIGNAQTGTGKTAAFVIPLINRLTDRPPGDTRVLVLVPTRELAVQIDDHVVGLAYHTKVKSAAIYGGVPMDFQERALKAGVTFVVATPGRLLDHHRYNNWRFDKLEVLVLDEADRMLDMGFMPDIQSIISKIPAKRQTLLFSATMPDPIVKLANKLMKDPVHIKVGSVTPPSSISQYFYPVSAHQKEKLLYHLLRKDGMESVIVFVATKIGADRLWHRLVREKFRAGAIHGGREQDQRDKVMNEFKSGILNILVAPDVAARGIDIDDVSHVINYDIPFDPDSYIHRIGRTARAEAKGDAITFITPPDEEAVAEIERIVKKQIPRIVVEGFQEPPRPGESHGRHDSRHAPSRHGSGPSRGHGGGGHRGSSGGHSGGHSRHGGGHRSGGGGHSHGR